MQITLINLEEDKGWNWSFRTKLAGNMMLDMFFDQFETIPEHNYYKEDNVMAIVLNNKQIEEVLGNLSKKRDFLGLFSTMIKDLKRLQNKSMDMA